MQKAGVVRGRGEKKGDTLFFNRRKGKRDRLPSLTWFTRKTAEVGPAGEKGGKRRKMSAFHLEEKKGGEPLSSTKRKGSAKATEGEKKEELSFLFAQKRGRKKEQPWGYPCA